MVFSAFEFGAIEAIIGANVVVPDANRLINRKIERY